MLTLPQAVVLLALHDERGTIHPAAYIALDMAVCAGVLSELRLRRIIGFRDGRVGPRRPHRTSDALLDEACDILRRLPAPGEVSDWLHALHAGLPGVRDRVVEQLTTQGILTAVERERAFLDDGEHHPMVRGDLEHALTTDLRRAMLEGGSVDARLGCLISLAAAGNLIEVLFEGRERLLAQDLARRVVMQDPVGSALADWVARADGTWEG